MRLFLLSLICVVGGSCLSPQALRAQEWSRFRGPNGMGLSEAKDLPATWTEADYQWRVALPGVGHSSPVLWGDKIFLNSADAATATRYVVCLSAADGRELWRRQYASQTHSIHARNTYGSSTPAVDAERIYVAWSTPARLTLLALDHDGRDVWDLDLGPVVSEHGFGTSPMLYQDLVILSNNQQAYELEPGQQPGRSSMLAFDAKGQLDGAFRLGQSADIGPGYVGTGYQGVDLGLQFVGFRLGTRKRASGCLESVTRPPTWVGISETDAVWLRLLG